MNARNGTVIDNGASSVAFIIKIFPTVKPVTATIVAIKNFGLSRGTDANFGATKTSMKGSEKISISQFIAADPKLSVSFFETASRPACPMAEIKARIIHTGGVVVIVVVVEMESRERDF